MSALSDNVVLAMYILNIINVYTKNDFIKLIDQLNLKASLKVSSKKSKF